MITELNVTKHEAQQIGERLIPKSFEMVFSGDFTIGELEENIKNKDVIKLDYFQGKYILSYYSLRATLSEPLAMELVGIGVTLIK